MGSQAPPNCNVIRLTEEHDMTTDAGLQFALKAINKENHLLWVSIPCIGGLSFQEINRWKCNSSVYEERMEGYKEQFDALWANLVILASVNAANGGKLALEWPTGCKYWTYLEVNQLLKELGCAKVHFHGCTLGLDAGNSDSPILKPWTISTNEY